MPVSIILIGNENEIIGIKVTSYNDVSREDKGFFLKLLSDQWLRGNDEKIGNKTPGVRQGVVGTKFTICDYLNEQGY